tara:strand:- start:239 stop:682 length:444 start_codon:yes stop_codon:yes gene_type:complete
MIEYFRTLKKELLLIVILKSMLVYSLTVLSLNELKLFETQNGLLSFFIQITIPLITFKIIKNKGIEFSLKYFIVLGMFISVFSTLIRTFLLDKLLTELIYNNIFSNETRQVIDILTTWERIQEFSKFTLIGILFFVIIGFIIKVKKN